MNVTATAIPGVLLIAPRVFSDDRGFFYESFNQQAFDAVTGASFSFVQDNHSRSARGVLRGLHYQLAPRAQGKLVRVVRGAVFDVAVDIRRSGKGQPAIDGFRRRIAPRNTRRARRPCGGFPSPCGRGRVAQSHRPGDRSAGLPCR